MSSHVTFPHVLANVGHDCHLINGTIKGTGYVWYLYISKPKFSDFHYGKTVHFKDRGYLRRENERKRDLCVVSLLLFNRY